MLLGTWIWSFLSQKKLNLAKNYSFATWQRDTRIKWVHIISMDRYHSRLYLGCDTDKWCINKYTDTYSLFICCNALLWSIYTDSNTLSQATCHALISIGVVHVYLDQRWFKWTRVLWAQVLWAAGHVKGWGPYTFCRAKPPPPLCLGHIAVHNTWGWYPLWRPLMRRLERQDTRGCDPFTFGHPQNLGIKDTVPIETRLK